MRLRGVLASIAAVAVLGACGAASAQPAAKPGPTATPVAASKPTSLTVEDAQRYAATESGGHPLRKVADSWDCSTPINISIAAAPGWSGQQVYGALEYSIAYLQALGYQVNVVGPSTYAKDMVSVPTESGLVVVAVAPNRAEQVDLTDGVGVTLNDADSGLILLDASRNGLRPDIILHEFGHLLGLDHREVGSVMSAGWSNSGHFDADETATITCH
jgi:hypothetical protein